MITVENLFFDYSDKRALQDISFTLEPGTITALVGPNGAGKTTLMRCLSALETPISGKILLQGVNTQSDPRKAHTLCTYLPDNFGLYDSLTVKQHLQFFGESHGLQGDNLDKRIQEVSLDLNLVDYLNTHASKLSRGLRQRLAIGMSIIHQPKIILLDEPAAGLDPKARYELSTLIVQLQKKGITLLVSSHILTELEEYSTHILILQDGKMVKHQPIRSKSVDTHLVFDLNLKREPKTINLL